MGATAKDKAAPLLAAIVESSGDAIVSEDLDGIITSWNRAAEQMFGHTAREAIGRSILLIIPEERHNEEAEVLRRIRGGRSIDRFETVRVGKDGRRIDVSLTVSPVRDSEGTVIGASKIARDITERKRYAAVLADLQSRLFALVEASASLLESPELEAVLSATISIAREQLTADGYALWRLEPDGWRAVRSLEISPEFAGRIVDCETSQQPDDFFTQPLIAEDVSKVPVLAQQLDAYRTEGIESMLVFPLRVLGERSSTLVFYYRRRRRFDEVELQLGRALANLAATAINTATLYDRQQAYRESAERERQRAAFLAGAGAALSTSLDYEKTLATVANLAVPTIADWCAVEILNDAGELCLVAMAHADQAKIEMARTLRERYPGDPTHPGSIGHVVSTGKPFIMSEIPHTLMMESARDEEHARILKALSFRSYICVPLTVRRRTIGAITFVMAESGRRYTEEDLRFAQDVAWRAALAVENARAYRRVNEASRIKDEFLATLSHELRTPLNAVLGYARMLRWGMPENGRPRALEIIERNAVALNQIIEDVLDMSRIVAGKLHLNVRPVRLQDLLADATASILPAAAARGVRVETFVDQAAGAVSGDPDRLQQVVWNLLSNAVKFTPQGGSVRVRLERVESRVDIVVTDTGEGIPRQFLPHVFERFRQADAGFSRGHGGLGLGLAIVREIVEMHGGSVQAESDGPGAGSTFRVMLPLARTSLELSEAPGARQSAWPHKNASPRERRRLDGVRVVAVDDEEDALGLLRTILEAAGADVRTLPSAAEALVEIERDPPDVLVSDLGMPEMDGVALIRRVRQSPNPRVQTVPALALTAYARSDDRITSLASGYQMHVPKPADPDEILTAVSSLMGRSGTRI